MNFCFFCICVFGEKQQLKNIQWYALRRSSKLGLGWKQTRSLKNEVQQFMSLIPALKRFALLIYI